MNICIISGTNRKNANSYKVSAQYLEMLKASESGKATDAFILDLDELPYDFIFSALYDQSGKNKDFNTLSDKVMESDRFVFVTPEYNNSIPGVLKAFIDGLPYPSPLKGKKAVLVGLSSGPQGGVIALSHLTDILHYLGMQVHPLKVRIPFIDKSFQEETFSNPAAEELIAEQISELVDF